MLTIAKPKRWSIDYYIDTALAAEWAVRDLARAGGGLGEYYSERETHTTPPHTRHRAQPPSAR